MPNSSPNLQLHTNPQSGLKGHDGCSLHIQNQDNSKKKCNSGISKTSDYIQIKTKTPNLSQDPSVSSKAPNQDSNGMDDLCSFKIKIESTNLDQGFVKDK